MEAYLAKHLGYSIVKRSGKGGGGCISQGEMYHTDKGKIFVKGNPKDGSDVMFEGELASLAAIENTQTVKVPHPIKVLPQPSGPGSLIAMEYLDMKHLGQQSELGACLARLHRHNIELPMDHEGKIHMFGFHVKTCCGFLPQGNGWKKDWSEFYSNKLEEQISRQSGDMEVQNLWSRMKPELNKFWSGLTIEPSLLHGDLWSGNVAQCVDKPVVFDAASFYGHHEYDLAIAGMFGGFNNEFYKAYHQIIPKEKGFEKRQSLYQLFHYLNHWNHFGGGYRSQSISIMKRLLSASLV